MLAPVRFDYPVLYIHLYHLNGVTSGKGDNTPTTAPCFRSQVEELLIRGTTILKAFIWSHKTIYFLRLYSVSDIITMSPRHHPDLALSCWCSISSEIVAFLSLPVIDRDLAHQPCLISHVWAFNLVSASNIGMGSIFLMLTNSISPYTLSSSQTVDLAFLASFVVFYRAPLALRGHGASIPRVLRGSGAA